MTDNAVTAPSPPRGKCLLTGYPGFLGSHLYEQLSGDFELYTLGLGESTTANHIAVDLSQTAPDLPDVHFDLVIHAAGKAHSVPVTEAEKAAFFQVNENGTRHLLEALSRQASLPSALALISTVAVYGQETGQHLDESHPLEATDPYGLSKINAETAVREWGSEGTIKAIVRLPLIAGPNAPGNLGNMIRSIQKGYYFNVGGGTARRSFVWIDDIAPFICRLVAGGGGTYNLTDGRDTSFNELYQALCQALGKRPNPSLPTPLAVPLAVVGDVLGRLAGRRMPFDRIALKKMTTDLTFSSDSAMNDLAWEPTCIIDNIGKVV